MKSRYTYLDIINCIVFPEVRYVCSFGRRLLTQAIICCLILGCLAYLTGCGSGGSGPPSGQQASDQALEEFSIIRGRVASVSSSTSQLLRESRHQRTSYASSASTLRHAASPSQQNTSTVLQEEMSDGRSIKNCSMQYAKNKNWRRMCGYLKITMT